jgi:hypothetical protein
MHGKMHMYKEKHTKENVSMQRRKNDEKKHRKHRRRKMLRNAHKGLKEVHE